jgi:hypothetical protein
MPWVSPPNHTDAMLVHDPTISLDTLCQLDAIRAICQETYDNPYADGSIEIRKVPSDIVLGGIEKREGQCAHQYSNVKIGNPC